MNEDQEQVLLQLNRKVSQMNDLLHAFNGRLGRIEKDLSRLVRVHPQNHPPVLAEGSEKIKGNDFSKNQVCEWLKRFRPQNPR